jgi:hypothetical protein
MPITPKFAFKISKEGTSIKCKDVTGPRSASNTGGYGSPNETFADIVSSTVQITTPAGLSYIITGVASDVYNETTIQGTSLGFPAGTTLVDGVYQAEFVLVSASTTYTYTTQFFVTHNVECCFEKAQAEEVFSLTKSCSCGGERSKIADYFYIIWSANKAFYCGKIETAKALLAYLQTACQTLSCTNC